MAGVGLRCYEEAGESGGEQGLDHRVFDGPPVHHGLGHPVCHDLLLEGRVVGEGEDAEFSKLLQSLAVDIAGGAAIVVPLDGGLDGIGADPVESHVPVLANEVGVLTGTDVGVADPHDGGGSDRLTVLHVLFD